MTDGDSIAGVKIPTGNAFEVDYEQEFEADFIPGLTVWHIPRPDAEGVALCGYKGDPDEFELKRYQICDVCAALTPVESDHD